MTMALAPQVLVAVRGCRMVGAPVTEATDAWSWDFVRPSNGPPPSGCG